MRRYLHILCFAILPALFSCSPEVSVYPVDPYKGVVLNASYVGGSGTKTEIGQMTSSHSYAEVLWSKNDALSLFFNDAQSALVNARMVTDQPESPYSVFYPSPSVEITGNAFIGLYPYSVTADASIAENKVTTVIPPVQTAVKGTFDPTSQLAVGKAGSLSANVLDMDFYNVCSGICFTLTSNAAQYKRIVFEGNAGEKLAGPVTISLVSPSEPAVTPGDGASASVELTLSGSDAFAAGTDYYLSFIPGFFASGFKVSFYGDGQEPIRTCTCSVPVSFVRGHCAYVTAVDDPTKLAKIRDGKLLTVNGESANCYTVGSAGCYKFPMVKGNDPESELSGVSSVVVLWETDNTSSAPAVGSIVTNVGFNKGYIYFDTPAVLKNGNALIAAKNQSGKILWSWHIWVCSDFANGVVSHTLSGKNKPMMDRNIGALSSAPGAASNGFFYQWGRKDPFPGAYKASDDSGAPFATTLGAMPTTASSSETTEEWSAQNPTVFVTSTDHYWLPSGNDNLWGSVKTIYDPCPPGWRVPGCVSWEGDAAWADVPYERTSSPYNGVFFSLSGSNDRAWYPSNGYLHKTGVIKLTGQYARYWSCDVNGSFSFAMTISQNAFGTELYLKPYDYGAPRVEGHSVRCIAE